MSRPKKQVKLMPAIREESSFSTHRIPVHIIPPGTRPRGPFQNSMLIQTLPEEPKKPPPKVTPSNRYHDNVEQVVADYLHFSKYGDVLPVTQGFAPSSCPCCMDRNRENMRLMKEKHRAPPPEPDLDAIPIPGPSSVNPDPGGAAGSPRRGVGFSDVVDVREVSPRCQGRGGGGHGLQGPESRDFPASWMDYQPAPHAQTYLNSEFNRASLLQSYQEDRKQYDDASMAYVSSRVLDANTKYDLAMKKLEQSLNKFSVTREDTDLI